MTDWQDDGPTRIATVDPVTGEIRPMEPTAPTDEDSQETQIFAPQRGKAIHRNQNAPFIPPGEDALPFEATAMWQPDARHAFRRPLTALCAKMPGRSGRFRFVVIVGAACVIIAGAGVLASSFGDPVDAPSPTPPLRAAFSASLPQDAPKAEVPMAPVPKPPPTPMRPIVGGEVQRPRLVHAAEALTLGRYETARDIYRELCAWNPKDPASRLALDILEKQPGEESR